MPMIALAALLLAAGVPALPAGTYTNEEDRYFAGEAKRPVPDWLGVVIAADGRWRPVDVFGKVLGDWQTGSLPGLATDASGKITVTAANKITTELRRGAAFRCWVSVKRFAAKPDGSPDYTYHPGLALHDAGGRAQVSDPDAPPVVIRLRNVIWPAPSTNKPSLVLYVHRPEEPDKAVSYVWADPQAKLIGINLRWMQGSCSREKD